jgi:hypothetical protein
LYIIIKLLYFLLIYGGEQGTHPTSQKVPTYSIHPPPQSQNTVSGGGAAVVVVGGASVVVVVVVVSA